MFHTRRNRNQQVDNGTRSSRLRQVQPLEHNAYFATPGVIVVGSRTTALLVKALAQEGMLGLSQSPDDFPYQRATIRRAATWVDAASETAEHAPCVVVFAGMVPETELRDRWGNPVRMIAAETLLEGSRKATANRYSAGAIGIARPMSRGWLRTLIDRFQTSALSRLAKQGA